MMTTRNDNGDVEVKINLNDNTEFDYISLSGDMLDVAYVSSNGSDYGNGSSEHPFR